MPQTIDLLIEPRWTIPVEPAGVVLEGHAVAVHDGRILDILPATEAGRRYAATDHQRLPDHALIPGLVNLHTHAAMTLLRGIADDLPLKSWLEDHIWPAEGRHVSPGFVRDGTLLACAEMLRGGVTCFNDMYFFPEAAAGAALALGMRAAIGLVVLDIPNAYACDADDHLAKGLAVRDALRDEPLLSFCLAPHAPYTVGDKSFEKIITLAEQLELPLHIHIHETADEIHDSVSRHGVRPIERLRRLGLLSPAFIGVHAVHLTPEEIGLLAEHGCSVAHCPTSNLKLASGIAPLVDLLAAGVNVGLGTDGAASNNRLDILQEMRLAVLLAKGTSGDAAAVDAHRALRMATLAGARALGLDTRIGSIEKGKAADLCAVDLGVAACQPCYAPGSHLTYVADRENVDRVWVGGQLRVAGGKLLRSAENDLVTLAKLWQNKIECQS